MAEKKYVKDSVVNMTEFVLPNDTNTLNNLMGGRMLHFMDIAAAISAQKHCNRIVVTASVDHVSFHKGIALGSVVTLRSYVTRAFGSSMEVRIQVWVENLTLNTKEKSNEAYFTFVAVDQVGTPIAVPKIIPETEEEKKYYDSALRRREMRLILSGKMAPKDADELKAIFMDNQE